MNKHEKVQAVSGDRARIRSALSDRSMWIAAALLVVVALLAIAANLFAPVLSFTFPRPDGSSVVSWTDLRDPAANPYEQSLLVLPLVAYAMIALFGAAMIARLGASRMRGKKTDPWVFPALVFLTFAGFVLTLTGSRWLGFYIAHLLQEGQALAHLHVVPYLNMVLGVMLLVGATRSTLHHRQGALTTRPHHRWSLWTTATAMAGLILMPLVPFARGVYPGVTLHLGEFDLALTTARASMWDLGAGYSLAATRLMVWLTMGVSTLAVLVSHLDGQWRIPPRLRWTIRADRLGLLFILGGIAATVRFYERLPHLGADIRFGVNPFLPLTFAALAVLWWVQGRQPRRVPRP